MVIVIILFLVHLAIGTDQIKAIETLVYLLAGGGASAASIVRHHKPATDQGQ
ncbi:hypothetical protein [Streptomyces mirabilis]